MTTREELLVASQAFLKRYLPTEHQHHHQQQEQEQQGDEHQQQHHLHVAQWDSLQQLQVANKEELWITVDKLSQPLHEQHTAATAGPPDSAAAVATTKRFHHALPLVTVITHDDHHNDCTDDQITGFDHEGGAGQSQKTNHEQQQQQQQQQLLGLISVNRPAEIQPASADSSSHGSIATQPSFTDLPTTAAAAVGTAFTAHASIHDVTSSTSVTSMVTPGAAVNTIKTISSSNIKTTTTTTPSSYPSFWQQYTALVKREYLCVTRNPADVAGRTLTFAWVAAMVGLIYYNMPADASSMRSRINLLYSGLCFFLLMPFISMSLYSADKRFYVGDTAARLYKPLPYHLAKVSSFLLLFASFAYVHLNFTWIGDSSLCMLGLRSTS